MKIHIKLLLLVVSLSMLSMKDVEAIERIAIIVNKENSVKSLSTKEIKKVYMNRTLKWPNGKLVTFYDLTVNDPVREVFTKRICNISSRKMAQKWAYLKLNNQAKNPPINAKSQLHVIKRIALDKRAIGYVSLNLLKKRNNPKIKIINVLE